MNTFGRPLKTCLFELFREKVPSDLTEFKFVMERCRFVQRKIGLRDGKWSIKYGSIMNLIGFQIYTTRVNLKWFYVELFGVRVNYDEHLAAPLSRFSESDAVYRCDKCLQRVNTAAIASQS